MKRLKIAQELGEQLARLTWMECRLREVLASATTIESQQFWGAMLPPADCEPLVGLLIMEGKLQEALLCASTWPETYGYDLVATLQGVLGCQAVDARATGPIAWNQD